MIRVLHFTAEPGGAAVLAPVMRLLGAQPDFGVSACARGVGRQRLLALGCHADEAGDDAGLSARIARERPDLVITSATSIPAMEGGEHSVWKACAELDIPCLAMLDQWQNYRLRFARPGDSDLTVLPSWINCLNELGREEMLADGLPAERLVALGHPALGTLHPVGPSERAAQRAALRLSDGERVFLFVGEPIEAAFGRQRGYHQYDAMAAVAGMIGRCDPDALLLVKPHPKDDPASYAGMATKIPRVVVSSSPDVGHLIAAADRVYGMTSVALIEAFLRGIPVASIQPGLTGVDQLVLSRHGFIECATDPQAGLPSAMPLRSVAEFECGFDGARFVAFCTMAAEHGLVAGSAPLAADMERAGSSD